YAHLRGVAVGRYVGDRDGAIGMQRCGDQPDRRFDPVIAGLHLAKIRKRRDQSDRAVTAHADAADVVEKYHAARIGAVDRRAQDRAHQDIGSSRLVDDRSAPGIVRFAEDTTALRDVAVTEVGAPADNHARGLTARVGVDDAGRYHSRAGRREMQNFDYSRRREMLWSRIDARTSTRRTHLAWPALGVWDGALRARF